MRRLLIISTTFFPDPTVPAIRMTQWARELPRHGWRPHVLCRYFGHEATAAELASDVHPEVVVEYLDKPAADGEVRQRRTGAGRRMARALVESPLGLGGLWVPDPSITFWRRQREQVLARVNALRPDVVLTTSPSHSVHDLGLWLAAETGIPWVADFRDPYLIDNRFQPRGLGRLRMAAHRRFEESIYRRAWLITHAIPVHARHARRRYPFARERIQTLTNGFPMEMLPGKEEVASADRVRAAGTRRTILVTGTIPETALRRLARAVARLAERLPEVQLSMLGKRPDCESELRGLLGDRLHLPGYVPHAESVRAIRRAAVLVNFLDDFRRRSRLLSTKLFEYLASGNPVLAVNSSRADRLLLWRATGVMQLIEPDDNALGAALEKLLSGEVQREPGELERFRAAFHWPGRAAQLARWLDRLVAFPAASTPQIRGASALGPAPRAPVATVVITTRNRRELLVRPLHSALQQSVPVEVLLVDDGSTDGTAEAVQRMFPEVRIIRHETSAGYIVRRNEAARLAQAPVIFSLDDDAHFSSPEVIAQTLALFEDPRVGAVAIPCKDVRRSLDFRQPSGEGGFRVTDAFIGTAHAVRRELFLQLGGYREHLVHQGEESDFCLRMLDAGFFVRLGTGDPIHHFESPKRDFRRMDYYGARNAVLFAWQNVPWPYLPLHLAATTFKVLTWTFAPTRLWLRFRAGMAGYLWCLRNPGARQPVKRNTYEKARAMRQAGALALQDCA